MLTIRSRGALKGGNSGARLLKKAQLLAKLGVKGLKLLRTGARHHERLSERLRRDAGLDQFEEDRKAALNAPLIR